MRILANEPRDLRQLAAMVAGHGNVPRMYSVAVEALVFDHTARWILMRRGPGCRDEIGRLEGIGGRVEEIDTDFRSALQREVAEEAGADASVRIAEFFEVRLDSSVLQTDGQRVHWLIVSYLCALQTNSKLQVMEPRKNAGFGSFDPRELRPDELSSSAAAARIALLAEWERVLSAVHRSS